MSNCPSLVTIKILSSVAQVLERVIYTHFLCFPISYSILHLLVVDTYKIAQEVSLPVMGPAVPSNLIHILGAIMFFHDFVPEIPATGGGTAPSPRWAISAIP